ncbi:MAG TPA: saccharopine dehydrogenase NADP-binding domain-containing protein [Chthoniobacterales bacterium]|nr:saccharopine dehydrogenase NADP-binding domain-containing protein [Chthoniobacterales bacterium]
MANMQSTTNPTVAVFGAAGHTGRFVVLELGRRGIAPIVIARDLAALTAANFGDFEVSRRRASVDDMDSLDRALDGAHAVINCAGPFLETSDAVVAAAVRKGIHYLDLTAEQPSACATLDKYDIPARKAGIAVVPAMGFYGGFADLLVTAALGDWDRADTIEILVGLDSWHPTRGTRITGERNTARRMVIADGQLTPVPLPAAEKDWEFGDPVGRQTVVEVPLSEIVLIARHLKTRELHTYLSSNALQDIRDPATPAPKAVDATGSSSQQFVVDAVVKRDGKNRRITARGRDIYAFSAPLVCEATACLVERKLSNTGAQPPGAIFDAQKILSALRPDHLTFEITAS